MHFGKQCWNTLSILCVQYSTTITTTILLYNYYNVALLHFLPSVFEFFWAVSL